ncbi:MAG TPA: histidine kinase [Puia sp.]|jgi:drug/metabolite transporter superfamily protein YnfA
MAHFLLRFRWHILFWLAYFIGWTWFSVATYHTPLWIALSVTMAFFLGQATMIYLTIYRWIPRLFKPRRIGRFFAALTGTILCGAAFTTLTGHLLLTTTTSTYNYPLPTFFGYVLAGNVYWEFLAIGFFTVRDRLRNERRNQRLEKEHTENELRFLKSQMNPHFLFNAINSIYVLIRKDPGLAEHTLARFSDMLRYQLYDCATDFIPIEKEITYLENYIRLEQLRKGSMLDIDYSTDETVAHFSIAPLLLMPLVENAFKFVSSFSELPNQVRIRLLYADSQFVFEIGNTVDEFVHTGQKKDSGIGLENVRRRLELLYPLQHTLTIDAAETYYTVALKLKVA